MPRSHHEKYIVRLPVGIRDQIKTVADREGGRSMNSLIVQYIKEGLEQSDPETKTAPEGGSSEAVSTNN